MASRAKPTRVVDVEPGFYSKLLDRLSLPVAGKSPMDTLKGLVAKLEAPEGPKLHIIKHGARPPAFIPIPIDHKHYPKKWTVGEAGKPNSRAVDAAGLAPIVKRGMIVFYRGLRYWVERVPKDWSESCAVYISDEKVHPDEARLNSERRESFCVHADLLDEAPQVTRIGAALPTVASAARAERAKAGIRDVGDEVAVLLRDCKDLDGVYAAAAKYLGKTVKELKAKYGHLNAGQQRMNCGNAMRYAWKVKNGLAGKKK